MGASLGGDQMSAMHLPFQIRLQPFVVLHSPPPSAGNHQQKLLRIITDERRGHGAAVVKRHQPFDFTLLPTPNIDLSGLYF